MKYKYEKKDKLDIEYFFKEQMIELVQEHKKDCNREGCTISSAFLFSVLGDYGMKFTKEEARRMLK